MKQRFNDTAQVVSAIRAADEGDTLALDQLFATLYRELHRMAKRQLQNTFGATLSATTLLHEVYLDMAGRCDGFPDRARFFAYGARAMRGLIIDHVRGRRALKRGSEFHFTELNAQIEGSIPEADHGELVLLDGALNELVQIDTRLAEMVDLKFFCGFSFKDIATMRGVSERTVRRDWRKARAYLRLALKEDLLQ